MPKEKKCKKYPCPDCNFCQWCDDSKCRKCRPAVKESIEKKKPNKPVLQNIKSNT